MIIKCLDKNRLSQSFAAILSTFYSYLLPIVVLMAFLLCSCEQSNPSSDPFWANRTQISLLDFEADSSLSEIEATQADLTIVQEKGVTNGNQALKITFKGDEKDPGIIFKPKVPIDASAFENFGLVFDATNLTEDYSVQFRVLVINSAGQRVRRASVIPIGETKTYFLELAGPYVNMETGLRDDPHPWENDSEHMKILGLKNQVDFSEIAAIHFKLSHTIAEKAVVIDQVRLVETPAISDDYLVGIVDKFGQPAKADFPGKVTSDEELKNLASLELKQLEEEGRMAGRTKFGGWLDGPKLEATGFFRAEKVGAKWALVDPEGHLFFSHGIANVRMANTTSFTGRDFRNDTVRYRDPEDVTPEDSRGMVQLGTEVTSTSYVAYPDRYKMFLDLPTYDSPLANHYSYRREQHLGPFAHGETFSHYQANLERRYGEQTEGGHLEKWVDVTLNRFLNWGFTSFGNWAGYEFYHENRLPYFANGWIIGDFKTVRSGMDYWGPMPDVFDPEFARRAQVTVEVIAEEVKNNPWCIGVFIDNEKSWGLPGSTKTQYGIVLYALAKNISDSPIKTEYIRLLKTKYGNIQTLNTAWETDIPDWKTLETGVDYKERGKYSEAMVEDFSMLLVVYAEKYFQVVHDALEEVMPNHMYMGCRFASWGMGKEVRKAAMKYVDVFSYNYYQEAIGTKYWSFLEAMDRPSIIGEFHMGTLESGLFHPGLIHAADQQDRAKMYKKYMETVIDNPYFVGAHWFQYLDSPTSGRAHDGENYNVGFVRITDVPYEPMVETAKAINSQMYVRRFGN